MAKYTTLCEGGFQQSFEPLFDKRHSFDPNAVWTAYGLINPIIVSL